jgi:hypothetical protein
MMTANPALIEGLRMAVPLEVERLRGTPPLQLWLMTRKFPELIGGHGDQLLYGGAKAGEVFAALATGIAALLLACPGGITVLGLHFCDLSGQGCTDPDCGNEPKVAVNS